MTGTTEACAAYFRSHSAYHRILKLLLQKYRGFGRPAGTICLSDATPEECDAARALFGRPFSSPLRIKTADFEAALQNTPYQGVVLKEVLECYFGTRIRTKHELSDEMDACILRLLEQVKASVHSSVCHRWLDDLAGRGGEGYQLIRKAVSNGTEAVQNALLYACRGADYLEEHPAARIRLAVLSAHATSDPHTLDSNTLCGKLFLHFLSAQAGGVFPSGAEDRAALYYNSGILCDSISSSVTQVGVRLFSDTGEHPAYLAFRLGNEAGTLTLTNMSGINEASSPSGRAYLVENQMVFSQLCDQAASFHSPLICTSGQPTVAAVRLLDMLAASGTELYYAGDFDGKGLTIALQLLRRYPDHLHLWHMGEADYIKCRSDREMSKDSLALLQNCTSTILAPVAEAVRRSGRAGYQELLLHDLLADLTSL